MENMRLKMNEIGMRSRFRILTLALSRRNQPESYERIGKVYLLIFSIIQYSSIKGEQRCQKSFAFSMNQDGRSIF